MGHALHPIRKQRYTYFFKDCFKMDLKGFSMDFKERMARVRALIRDEVPNIVGTEAVEQFKNSFEKQGFEGAKWPDVKRRDSASPWYGFQPGNKGRFSEARAIAAILHGTGELKEAITYRREPGRVVVSNDKPYARVHNEGGGAYVFGKTPTTLPKRQFMGHSPGLTERINKKISGEINKILKG